jgi:thiol-disulfide isomerase/thioredoxin
MRMWKLVLALMLVGCAPVAPGPAAPASAVSILADVGQTATDSTFLDQAGKRHRLSDYRGTFVVLTIWASWCPHCQAYLPKIQEEMYRPYAGKGVTFLNVETSQATPADVATFAAQQGISMPLFRDDGDSTMSAFAVQGYPTMIFIDPQGRVVATKVGEIPIAEAVAIFSPYLKR